MSGRGRRGRKRNSLPLPPVKLDFEKPNNGEGWMSDSEVEVHLMMKISTEEKSMKTTTATVDVNGLVEAEKEHEQLVPEKENSEEMALAVEQLSSSSPSPMKKAKTMPIMTPSKRELRSNSKNQNSNSDAYNDALQELERVRQKCSEMEETCQKYSELEGRMRESNQALVEAKGHLKQLKIEYQTQLAKILQSHGVEMGELKKHVRHLELKSKNIQLEADDARQKLAYETLVYQTKERDLIGQLEDVQRQKEDLTAANLHWQAEIKKLELEVLEASSGRENILEQLKTMEKEYQEKLENMASHYKRLEALMTEQINALRADNGDLEHKIANLKKQRSQELAESERAKEQTQETIKALKDSVIIFQAQTEQMIIELERKQEIISQCMEDKKKLESDLISAQETINDLKSKIKELTDSKSSLESDLNTSNEKSAGVIQQKKEEIERLKKEEMRMRFDHAKRMEDKDSTIRNLQHELALAITDAETKLMEKEMQMEDYADKFNRVLESKESMTQELKYLRESLRQKTSAHDILRLEHENLKTRFDRLNQEIGGLINEVVNSKQDAIRLKENLDDAVRKTTFYKNRLDELTTISSSTEESLASASALGDLDKEAEMALAQLKAELDEKQKVIDNLQREISAIRTPTSEAKKRRYFDM